MSKICNKMRDRVSPAALSLFLLLLISAFSSACIGQKREAPDLEIRAFSPSGEFEHDDEIRLGFSVSDKYAGCAYFVIGPPPTEEQEGLGARQWIGWRFVKPVGDAKFPPPVDFCLNCPTNVMDEPWEALERKIAPNIVETEEIGKEDESWEYVDPDMLENAGVLLPGEYIVTVVCPKSTRQEDVLNSLETLDDAVSESVVTPEERERYSVDERYMGDKILDYVRKEGISGGFIAEHSWSFSIDDYGVEEELMARGQMEDRGFVEVGRWGDKMRVEIKSPVDGSTFEHDDKTRLELAANYDEMGCPYFITGPSMSGVHGEVSRTEQWSDWRFVAGERFLVGCLVCKNARKIWDERELAQKIGDKLRATDSDGLKEWEEGLETVTEEGKGWTYVHSDVLGDTGTTMLPGRYEIWVVCPPALDNGLLAFLKILDDAISTSQKQPEKYKGYSILEHLVLIGGENAVVSRSSSFFVKEYDELKPEPKDATEFTLAVLRNAYEFLRCVDESLQGCEDERWYALSEATDSYEMHEIASSSAAEGFHFRQVFNNLESAESSSAASVVLEESIPCGLVKIRFTKLSGKSIIGIVGIGVGEYTEEEWCI